MKKGTLKGKVVWLTGGRRIGQSVAKALAELGADIVLSYRASKEEAEQTARMVKKSGRKAMMVQCDASYRQSVEKAVVEIKKKFGKLDILVLMASVFKPVRLAGISEADWDLNFSAHVKGTFWPAQLSAPLMKPGSHIITISDRTAVGRIYPNYLPYVVTKGAVAVMTKALAVELGPKGIFVNSIAPGPILKPDDISDKEWQTIRDGSTVKYPITDEEAVGEFVDTVIRLCFVRSSGSVYSLDLGHS